jgi:uncharacterized NAD-dependent epimerase/dehydratase family protein
MILLNGLDYYMTNKPRAIVLTDGMLQSSDAKTAHGLIRGTDRYEIVAVIDSAHAGNDAGEVLDGHHRNIPVLATVQAAVERFPNIRYCIIGVATVGGKLPEHFMPVIEGCIRGNMGIVNGLHEFLCGKPALVALAEAHGVDLIDVRKPKNREDLHFWDASIYTVEAPIIAVMGTDCALGKRTTCRLVMQACAAAGIHAEMVYTGQTGWMQGGRYGFIFDSTLNDFISGELEHALVSCWQETGADVILIEGQAALRNPSGPCGSEMLVSGNAKHVILVHAPKRKHYDHLPEWGTIHSVKSEIELIKMYGSQVIALALNTEGCTVEEALDFQTAYEASLQIPVLLALQQGVEAVVPVIRSLIKPRP